jgi:hypothetical protein
MQNYLRLMLATLLLAVVLWPSTPASAGGNYPYCMSRVAGRMGMVEECNYVSMEQCWANSTGVNGSCAPNWRLQYYQQQQAGEDSAIRRRTKRRAD